MYALLLLIVALLLPVPSQSTKPENKIIKNSTGANRKEAAKDKCTATLPRLDSQDVGVPSAPQNQDTKHGKNDRAPDGVYKVDIVTPPPKPLDTPLFSRYLLLTGIGIGVTGAGVLVNFLIWFSILRQTKSNRVVAAAANTSADAAIKNVNLVISKERARLRIEVQPLKLPDQTPFLVPNIEYKIRIYGPTEAIIRATVADTSVTESQEPPIGAALYWLSIPPIISGADSPFVARHLMNPTTSIEADIRDVRRGVKFVHFWGSIVYEDVFTNTYFTNFRFVWRPIVGVTSEDVQRISTWYKCGPPKDNSET
jgi:hypothetical protein